MNEIGEFQGQYRWLSNFVSVPVELDGETYPTVEHAYQAAKTTSAVARERVRQHVRPGEAKREGKNLVLRPGWDDNMKLAIMEDLLRQKFNQQPFRSWLLATGNARLVEGNSWGDRFWGVCKGVGHNHLGRLIMKIREELTRVG